MRLHISFLFIAFTGICISAASQSSSPTKSLLSTVVAGGGWPEKVLSTRSAVLYTPGIPQKELNTLQTAFQKCGIDAVVYFPNDIISSGKDVTRAYVAYLVKREISYFVFFEKQNTYRLYITPFSGKENVIDSTQRAWALEDASLEELAKKLYRTASTYKKQNFLVNDLPEMEVFVNPIGGRRSESFSLDLKVDLLAVPKFGNAEADKQLEEIMKNYPYKYALTDPNLSDKDLRKQGYLYVLNFIQVRNRVAKELLGYKPEAPGENIISTTYPAVNTPELKNIPPEVTVFKFYFKHIESGNLFLGTKWDADVAWQDALRNQLLGFKTELRIN